MANYVLVDADQLDADLASVADRIRAKGGTSGKLEFPEGYKTAVDAIKTGVTVQRKSGSFTTDTNGNATVNCGFKPDLVVITGMTGDHSGANAEYQLAFAFNEAVTNYQKGAAAFIDDGDYVMLAAGISQTQNGFTMSKMTALTLSFGSATSAQRTFNYVAIKYTE